MPYNKKSTFKVLERYGDPIQTRKATERIVVQRVEAGTETWVEARVEFLNDEGQWRGTKSALCFNNSESVISLLDALEAAHDRAVDDAIFKAEGKVDEPEVEEAPPIIPVKPRARAFGENALVSEH